MAMSGNIGDIFFRLVADSSGLTADVTKAGEAAGDKAGTAFSKRFGVSAGQTISLALGGALAFATKGLVELDTAMAKYRAETNATAAEEISAKATIIAANEKHKQSISELTDGLAAERTEMGLTQDAANALLGPMATFAEITGQTIPQAVKATDDILDAYNLTAADAVTVQDALVVAHQHGAGAITDIQGTLASMAPQLTAANLTWQDGAALLMAFGDAGVDAAKAPLALTHALSQVKSPAELQTLIDKIRNTADDFTRAQLATDLFGAKAGPQMAALLRPGSQSLADYKTQVDAAGGAVTAYADNLHDNLQYKISAAIKEIGGGFLALAAPAGPVISSIGTIVLALQGMSGTFDALKASAIASWLAVLGPAAVAGVAGLAFIAGIDYLTKLADSEVTAAQAAGDLTGAQAALKAQLDAGTISADDYDAKLKNVKDQQYLQANAAAIAAGADNAAADAAGKAAVANDKGTAAVKANTAATTAATQATTTNTTATGQSTTATDQLGGSFLDAAIADEKHRKGMDNSADGAVRLWSASLNAAAGVDTAGNAANNAVSKFDALALSIWSAYSQETKLLLAMGGGGAGALTSSQTRAMDPPPEATGSVDLNPPKKTRTGGGGGGGASQAQKDAKDAAAAIKLDMTQSFAAAKTAGDAFYDALHAKVLKQIDESHQAKTDAIRTEREKVDGQLAEQKRLNAAPVTAAEKAQQAIEDARRERDLKEQLTAAQASGDALAVRSAEEALQSYEANQNIDALRTQQAQNDALAQQQADAANADLDARQKKADDDAKLAEAAENAEAPKRKKRFDDALADLEAHLLKTKGSHQKAIDDLNALWAQFGIDGKAHGKKFAIELAAGLIAEQKAVANAAQGLAQVIEDYLKTHSPAKIGPLHDNPPDEMGQGMVQSWSDGARAELARQAPAIFSAMMGGAALPSGDDLFNARSPMTQFDQYAALAAQQNAALDPNRLVPVFDTYGKPVMGADGKTQLTMPWQALHNVMSPASDPLASVQSPVYGQDFAYGGGAGTTRYVGGEPGSGTLGTLVSTPGARPNTNGIAGPNVPAKPSRQYSFTFNYPKPQPEQDVSRALQLIASER